VRFWTNEHRWEDCWYGVREALARNLCNNAGQQSGRPIHVAAWEVTTINGRLARLIIQSLWRRS
jgi:hypothetical protein